MTSKKVTEAYITKNIITIIPARCGSKSIHRKNIIDFCGKPLIAWTIEHALKSRYVKGVYVTTESDEIENVSKRYGAEIIRRPTKLATDTSSSEEALLHVISEIEKYRQIDTIVFLQATSPLREEDDIDKALEKFFSEKADSLFSATMLEDFCLWEIINGKFKSVTFDYKNRGRRQDRKPYYLENGSIYIFNPDILRKYSNRLGGKIVFYPMPLWKSYEIDSIEDLKICEYFMKSRLLKKQRDNFLLKNIHLIVYDFDGVLTDNKVTLREDGFESVVVNRSDGLAIGMIKEMGIKQVILTKERNMVVETRAKKLGIPSLRGVDNKKEALIDFCKKNDISLECVVYIGNDLNDLEVMQSVGYPVCPLDAYDEVKSISKVILDVPGGEGVVRDFLKYIVTHICPK
ncbi:MAG: hypothetical protein A2042_05310 [Candidatus Schekmanbacteria bacterium GWA2_38_11]|uniref:N-acylneuraminate cytidylyltransferase n=1 Tax=Candidatus Schekmanbacteria bacterium GWA2_38_11 TaxID=1817876 RepID=A0A1F7RGV8_9BACT|nr:MAG: hypothetical protein A2042_05310 [Candidatus Schekmanbacteria bacterium GWA2_38_11]